MPLIITADCKDLLHSVSALQNVTGKKGAIAILANILLETAPDSLILTGTDLEVGIRSTIAAEVRSEGTITLPARKFFEILRETGDERISIEVSDNNWATITTPSGNYRLAGTDSEEYPTFPELDSDNLATVPCETLKECIDKTIFSIAAEGDSQFNLTAALMEKEERDGRQIIRFVTSDGHRLTIMEREVDTDLSALVFDRTILIPRKGVQEMGRFCERYDFVEIGFDDKQVLLRSEDSLLIIRLMNGDFPKYDNILDIIERKNAIKVERKPFMAAMKRINLFTEEAFSAVRFEFANGKLTLTSQNMDIGSGKEELAVDYDGQDLSLGFNGRYFIETLQVMQSDRVTAYINSDESPCMITGEEDPGFVSVVMPMKI